LLWSDPPAVDVGQRYPLTSAQSAFYIAGAVSSFMHWDTSDGPTRALLILNTLQMAKDIVKQSLETFNAYKEWKGTDAPTPEQRVAAGTLDNGVDATIRDEKTIAALDEAVREQSAYKETGISGSAADKYTENGYPLPEGLEEEGPFFNVPLDDDVIPLPIPKELPPAGKTAFEKFNTAANWLKVVGVAIGVGITVAMAIDLKNHWNDYNTAGKTLNTIQVIIQGLTVLCDAAMIVGDLVVEAGVIAATSSILIALPIVGAVLALIGVVIMVVLMFVNTSKKTTPSKTPVENFLDDTARPLLSTWIDPPLISLTYTIPPSVKAGASSQDVVFKVSNNSQAVVNLSNTTITVEGGNDPACLFTNTDMKIAITPPADNTAWVVPNTSVQGALVSNPSIGVDSYDFVITGTPTKDNTAGLLIIPPGLSFTANMQGIINKAGQTTVQIVETLCNAIPDHTAGDRCRMTSTIMRV
jgi:hypothetical protein